MHEELVGAYWEGWRILRGNRDERLSAEHRDRWADNAVEDAVEGGQPSSVALLVALAEGAPSDDDAGLIGAGPLEDLLAVHGQRMFRPAGAALLEQLDAAARTSPRFRRALRSVNVGDEVPVEVREQLFRFLRAPE